MVATAAPMERRQQSRNDQECNVYAMTPCQPMHVHPVAVYTAN